MKTRYWQVKMVDSDGHFHPHPGWVVVIEREPGPESAVTVAAEMNKARGFVQSFLDNGEDGEFAGFGLTADVLEFDMNKVAELH